MVLVACVVLAIVFAVAGLAKLADRPGARRAVVEFGVPRSVSAPVVWALTAAELGLALSLLFTPTARVGAIAVLAVLVFLSILVIINLARGRSVDCHCFGRLSSEASGWSSVARNAAFSSLAALVIFDGSFVWLFGLVGVVAVVVWLGPAALAGRRQRDAQRPGTRPADFSLPDASGGMSSFDGLVARQLPIVLVFSDPGCGPCSVLMPDVRR